MNNTEKIEALKMQLEFAYVDRNLLTFGSVKPDDEKEPALAKVEKEIAEIRAELESLGVKTEEEEPLDVFNMPSSDFVVDVSEEEPTSEPEEIPAPVKEKSTGKKYEMTDETITFSGSVLHRIRAVRDFYYAKAGELGGFIEKEENLSHKGICWVKNDAMVSGNAKVYGNAIISVNAKVRDNAEVFGCAEVSKNAIVKGNAKVYDDASVFGDVEVKDKARVYEHAKIRDKAVICGHAKVYDHAYVSMAATIKDNAEVFGWADIKGAAIVAESAKVYDEAKAYRSSRVAGRACVFGKACLCGSTNVYDDARVYGDTTTDGNVTLFMDADVSCNDDYLFIDGVGSDGSYNNTTFFKTRTDKKIGVRTMHFCEPSSNYWTSPYFLGDLNEFEKEVNNFLVIAKRGISSSERIEKKMKEFLAAINLAKEHFGLEKTKTSLAFDVFVQQYNDAKKYNSKDKFVIRPWENWMDTVADRASVIDLLSYVYDVSKNGFDEIDKRYKSLRELSDKFNIPYSTVQKWGAEKATPPEYLLTMMAYVTIIG